ncbi:MAG: bifunctional oligoribonuclease/PAP phosphatase NrnA [Bacteroidales bacterium]|nr:bifunctional oligoribonuclease/PAP phosphatase NrnA [Bacteroidales bacterium]
MHSHIQSSGHIALFTHINPDGDALGSSLGLASYLHDTGKKFTLFLPSEINESLSFMIPEEFRQNIVIWHKENEEQILEMIEGCDLFIGLDFNIPDRAGEFSGILSESETFKILIDHHVGPDTEHFNLVYSDPGTSSASELTYRLLMEMPGIDGDCSRISRIGRESLLTGMTTDTNNFANSAVPSTFRMAADLIAAGTDREKILQHLYFSYPQRRIQAQGYVLNRLLKITDDGVAYIILDRRFQNRFKIREGDTEGFVNIPLSMDCVRMSILLKREMNSKKIRVSVRSKKGISARSCAMRYFNGGGHEQASGGRLFIGQEVKNMQDVADYVEKCTHEFFME